MVKREVLSSQVSVFSEPSELVTDDSELRH